MPHPTTRRPAERFPLLLVAAAFGVWVTVVAVYVADLPDRVAAADQADRLAWSAD